MGSYLAKPLPVNIDKTAHPENERKRKKNANKNNVKSIRDMLKRFNYFILLESSIYLIFLLQPAEIWYWLTNRVATQI